MKQCRLFPAIAALCLFALTALTTPAATRVQAQPADNESAAAAAPALRADNASAPAPTPAAVKQAVPAEATKTFIAWYSRSGHSQLVAETLQEQLGADMEKIASKKDRGFFTIVGEQLLGGSDDQEKCSRDLSPYAAVIIAAPIYFMRLSAPARAFLELNREDLKDKDIYIFVTMGGKLPEGKVAAFKEYGAGLGLNIREVFHMQIGQKDQFPKRIAELLKTTSLAADGN